MEFDTYKKIFSPDSGSLLDIRIFDTTAQHWEMFLDYAASTYDVSCIEDGRQKPMPRFEAIGERSKSVSPRLQISLNGIKLNCSAFDVSQIEIDLLPDDVNSVQKAQLVCEFMVSVARLLNKEVFLMREFVSATPRELKANALCSVDPQSGSIHVRI